ncbi:MAG: NADP-dependent oxidoreductase [Chitinophagaceae bacterium]
MKAVVLSGHGGIETLKLADIPVPEIKPDEVLIEVKAIAINPADTLVRANHSLDWIFNGETNKILGWDVSGVVIKTGSAVDLFTEGDDVFGTINHPGHGRAYAEFVAAPASHLALKPINITHETAAAATLAALTSLQPMQKVGVHKGDRVLITAAGGGVGHFAVQLAKYFGAYVIALASGAKRDFVLSLGADEFVDYKTQKFEDVIQNVDVAVEGVKSDGHILRTLHTVKRGGTLISLWSQITPEEADTAAKLGVHAFYNAIQSSGTDMQLIAELLSSGVLRPHISEVYTLKDISLAHAAIEKNNTQGKIIVKIN